MVEAMNINYWFATVSVRIHFDKMTNIDPGIAEFAFIQYFDLTPPFNNVNTFLNVLWLQADMDDWFSHFLKYNFSLSEIIEAW